MNLPGMVDKSLHAIHHRMLDILKVINGGISMGDGPVFFNLPFDTPTPAGNMAGVQVSHTFAVANVATTISHNLGRIPVGYIPLVKTAPTDIYLGNIANWNDTTFELKASAPASVRFFVF